MKINLNETVRVTLTEVGAGILRDRAAEGYFPWPIAHGKAWKAGDEYEDSFWHLAHLFGPSLRMGLVEPFSMNAEIPGRPEPDPE